MITQSVFPAAPAFTQRPALRTIPPERLPALCHVDSLQLPEATVELARAQVCHHDGTCAALSIREAELLRYLASHPNRPVSRDEILLHVWHVNPQRIITRTIDMHVTHLRAKLRDDSRKPKILLTIRGHGYMLARTRATNPQESAGISAM